MSGARVGRSYPAYPRSQRMALPRAEGSVARTGAGRDGTLSNWHPTPITHAQEGREREMIALRSRDLHANNPHAASLIDSIAVNTVSSGLIPQAQPNFKRLGISEEQARELGELFQWEFKLWSREAVAEANHSSLVSAMDFGFRTLQNVTQMLVTGEFVNLPVWIEAPGRRYAFALQSVDPIRMRTPMSLKGSKNIRDGIRLGDYSQPLSYLIADPQDGLITSSLDVRHYREYPAMAGHRPGVIHRFVLRQGAEQVRGFGTLGPALKAFRDVHDYLDYELVGAIVAANFPVWIERQHNMTPSQVGGVASELTGAGDDIYYQNLMSGGIHYGNLGEKPHIMTPRQHSNAFTSFVETVIRSVGAASGMPYEVIAKDFSKTNYSSARAALLEAYRVFSLYQDWLIRGYLNMIWRMVLEEAVLRGYVTIPGGLDAFYADIDAWCHVKWTRPKRGSIDPVKDAVALKTLQQIPGASTLADFHGEGGHDWEDQVHQAAREKRVLEDAGLKQEAPLEIAPSEAQPDDDDDKETA